MHSMPSTNIARFSRDKFKLRFKGFKFNGWGDLTRIQKDKSYDVAIIFVQDCCLKNLPDISKLNDARLRFFFGGRGAEKEIVSYYENQFNEYMKS